MTRTGWVISSSLSNRENSLIEFFQSLFGSRSSFHSHSSLGNRLLLWLRIFPTNILPHLQSLPHAVLQHVPFLEHAQQIHIPFQVAHSSFTKPTLIVRCAPALSGSIFPAQSSGLPLTSFFGPAKQEWHTRILVFVKPRPTYEALQLRGMANEALPSQFCALDKSSFLPPNSAHYCSHSFATPSGIMPNLINWLMTFLCCTAGNS